MQVETTVGMWDVGRGPTELLMPVSAGEAVREESAEGGGSSLARMQ